jgi:hypothetical protein
MSTEAINPRESQVPEPNVARFLFADTRLAPVWLVVRVYLGVPGSPGTMFRRGTARGEGSHNA